VDVGAGADGGGETGTEAEAGRSPPGVVAGAKDDASGACCAAEREESPTLITGGVGLRAAWSASAKRRAASRVRA
jgi:hypothetical protein